MPLSSFCSPRQTSSSLMRRLIAPRPSDEDLDFFLPPTAGPAEFELESGRFWIRHDILRMGAEEERGRRDGAKSCAVWVQIWFRGAAGCVQTRRLESRNVRDARWLTWKTASRDWRGSFVGALAWRCRTFGWGELLALAQTSGSVRQVYPTAWSSTTGYLSPKVRQPIKRMTRQQSGSHGLYRGSWPCCSHAHRAHRSAPDFAGALRKPACPIVAADAVPRWRRCVS